MSDLQSPEAERGYLGSVLIENKTLIDFPTTPEYFYSHSNRTVFECMLEMASEKRPIDIITLADALKVKRKLEQVGGPGFIASLTDSVPICQAPASAYIGILQDWKNKRDLFTAGMSLAYAATSPTADAKQIVPATITLLEKQKPEPVKESDAKRIFNNYPRVPPEAWYGASELYRRAVLNSTNASHNFHLAAFLTVVGVILGKSVFTEEGGDEIYPNLFTVVIGEAGWARKDTAVNKAMSLLKSIDKEVVRLTGIASVQGFLLEMQTEQQELKDNKIEGPLRVIIRIREFKSLISTGAQKATSNVWPALCEFYDCPESMKNPTSGKPLKVDEPVGAILGASSPNWLKGLDAEMLEAGPGSRIIWVPGDPGPRLKHRQKPDQTFWIPLCERIALRTAHYQREKRTAFTFTEAAQDKLEEWAERHEIRRSGNQLIDMITARDETTVRKIALVHAALDGKTEIDIHHLQAAIAFVEFLYESRFPLFSTFGMTPSAEIEEKILKRVKESMPAGIAYQQIRRGIQRISYEQYERAMKSLTTGAAPPLKLGKLGPKAWVWTNDGA